MNINKIRAAAIKNQMEMKAMANGEGMHTSAITVIMRTKQQGPQQMMCGAISPKQFRRKSANRSAIAKSALRLTSNP